MQTVSTQVPVQERSKKTHHALLDALERLLAKKAFSALTVAEIATEADLTTGAIYRRFKDKHGLLLAAFDRFLAKTQEGSARIEDNVDQLNDSELLEFLISNTLYFTLDHIALMRAAASINDTASFERMRKARNLPADQLAGRLRSSPFKGEDLKHRTRFTMRMVTAVIRDTFLAGLGAINLEVSRKKFLADNKVFIEQLVVDLIDTAVAYLGIATKSNCRLGATISNTSG
ncbi:MAG: TetR/AcrR family transcriptional regulator [Pseudomonadales bacterium]